LDQEDAAMNDDDVRTLESFWLEYESAVVPLSAPTLARVHMRAAFFAGSRVALMVMRHAESLAAEQARAVNAALWEQIEAYRLSLEPGNDTLQ
jgi:hypothetical protein